MGGGHTWCRICLLRVQGVFTLQYSTLPYSTAPLQYSTPAEQWWGTTARSRVNDRPTYDEKRFLTRIIMERDHEVEDESRMVQISSKHFRNIFSKRFRELAMTELETLLPRIVEKVLAEMTGENGDDDDGDDDDGDDDVLQQEEFDSSSSSSSDEDEDGEEDEEPPKKKKKAAASAFILDEAEEEVQEEAKEESDEESDEDEEEEEEEDSDSESESDDDEHASSSSDEKFTDVVAYTGGAGHGHGGPGL